MRSLATRDVSGLDETGIVAEPPNSNQGDRMSWLTILIIVVVVLLVLGFFGRGRFRA